MTRPSCREPVELGLHVADDVLLGVEAQVAVVDVVHERPGLREEVAREALHLLGHLERVDALGDQRLVDEEVEQAHLGLGDLADRLRVDADELEQGDEREAGVEDRGDPLHRLDVLLGQRALHRGRSSEEAHDAIDQLLLEARHLGRLACASSVRSERGIRSST